MNLKELAWARSNLLNTKLNQRKKYFDNTYFLIQSTPTYNRDSTGFQIAIPEESQFIPLKSKFGKIQFKFIYRITLEKNPTLTVEKYTMKFLHNSVTIIVMENNKTRRTKEYGFHIDKDIETFDHPEDHLSTNYLRRPRFPLENLFEDEIDALDYFFKIIGITFFDEKHKLICDSKGYPMLMTKLT